MNQVTFTVNGKELVFTETEMRFANREFPYIKINSITHRDGEKPAFIFEFDGKRLALPYDVTDKEDIANLFTKIMQMNQNGESKIQLPELQEIEKLGNNDKKLKTPKHNLRSKKEKKKKASEDNQKSKKGCLIGIIIFFVLVIIIVAVSSCEPSFTKDEAVAYDKKVDNALFGTQNHFSDVVNEITKNQKSATKIYADIERHKNVISSHYKSLEGLEQTEYKDAAETYISNAIAGCEYAQEAINENNLESAEKYKQTALLVETQLVSDTTDARKAFLKEHGVSEKEINEIMNVKGTFK